MDEVARQFGAPARAETARLNQGVIHGNEDFAVKLRAGGVFLVVKSDDVRRAFVTEESLVETGHFRGGNEMHAQQVIPAAETILQQAAGQAAQQRPFQRDRALAVKEAHQFHAGARRCSS